MTKYVKLKEDLSALDSAIYSVRPRQLRSVNTSDYKTYNWYVVEEHYEYRTDKQLYRYVMQKWELQADGKVHVFYVPEMVNLEMRRSIMSNRVTETRDEKLSQGLMFRGKLFDTRPQTYMRVTGAALMAVRDPAFETHWITEDNSQVLLSAEDVLALGDAYAAFESRFIMFGRDLKDQIEVSNTPEQFDTNEGWPSNVIESTGTLNIVKDGSPAETEPDTTV